MHFPDLKSAVIGLRFFPLKSADVRGAGTHNIVLNYCKRTLKENYSCIFQFYALDEKMFFVLSESSLAGTYLEVGFEDSEID